jgi:exo-1,4-beta-D-glucosaminidase
MRLRKVRSRTTVPLVAVAALVGATLAMTSGAALAAPAHPAAASAAAPAVAAPAATTTKDLSLNTDLASPQYAVPGTVLGGSGWQVLSSATATQSGATISAPGFTPTGWLSVANDDGGAPGTEIEALLQNGTCPNVYYSTNMKTCFGYMSSIGADTIPEFDVPWWYRTNFNVSLASGQYASLIVNGVVGQADVWVDGTEVATQATVEGDFTRYTFNVTNVLKAGANSVALEVYPNNPNTMLTLDDVDWNQIPPDNNTGIQFPVQLLVSNDLSNADSHVVEADSANLSSSALTVKTNVTNNTSSSQTGVVSATVAAPAGGAAPITVQQTVTVPADTTQTVSFAPSAYPALTINNPQVWWPYQMGAQPLYTLTTSVSQGSTVSTSTAGTFGIRTVTSSLVGAGPVDENGVRQYSINGVPFVVRGGGFAEDLFLHYSASNIAGQIAILKNLGINMIRLEGHVFPDDFYEQMDEAGIMIDSGYQCCDAWGNDIDSGELLTVATNSALTIGQDQVDHPSVVTFSWSDDAPSATDAKDTLAAFAQADFDVPVVSSAEENTVAPLGDSGEKEGPYDWVPPDYWYDTTHNQPDDNQTNAGGSWGFDSEQSAGDTIPTLDSINRFLSPTEQDELWQSDTYNQYHANYETGHGQYEFGTLYYFDQALDARYGAPTSLDQYVEEGQVANYENTRAQFEAFIDHSTNTATPSTGTIYWQVNKGWPSVLWNIYNEDGDKAGSFYGAKKANETLHALYTQDNGTVTLDNLGSATQGNLTVEAKVYNTAGAVTSDQTSSAVSLTGQQVKNSVLTPKVPATVTTSSKATTYFVELILRQGSTVVDRNVYWQSTYPDVVNWTKTLDGENAETYAVMTQYANLTGLNSLSAAAVTASNITTQSQPGPDGNDTVTNVTLTDTSSSAVGFFLRTDLRRGNTAGTPQTGDNEVASALWSDDDVTLFPGESQTLSVTYKASDLSGATPVISLSGYNVAQQNLAAPAPGNSGGQSPTVPTNLQATMVTSTSAGLSWTASTDPAGVTGYDIYRNGSLVGTVTSGTTFTDTSVAASTTYSYTVAAFDAAGNTSNQSTALSVTTPAGAPSGGKVYEADTATLGGSADANGCTACLDGQKVSAIGGSGAGTVTISGVSEPSTGKYTMTVYYLSVSKARPAVITVDGVAQTVTFAETSATSYSVIGTATVTVQLNAGSSNTIEFSGSAAAGAPDLDHIVV